MPDIEEHIRRAIEEGKFDELPGKGKPLNLEENLLEDPEWRLAYHILRSSGYTLPWIEMRQEIEAEIEAARADLIKAWDRRQKALAQGHLEEQVGTEWKRAVETFRKRVAGINKKIFNYNLQVPSERFQRVFLNADQEIERLSET